MKKVLVIGSTGLVGSKIVELLKGKAQVIEASKSNKENPVDLSNPNSLKELFAKVGEVDSIICTAGVVNFDSWDNEDDANWDFGIANKMMGQINTIRFGKNYVKDGGSIILSTGVLAQYPMEGSCVVTTVNAAVEAAVKSAAFELKNIRVNAVSPGWVKETMEKYGMDSTPGMPALEVAQYYVDLIEASNSGEIVVAMKS